MQERRTPEQHPQHGVEGKNYQYMMAFREMLLDLYTAEHKTSSGLRREQFLPLVIPSEGIVQGDWIGVFIELCHRQGFDWNKVPYGPLLVPRAGGGWCARPLSTSEAATWLR